MQAYGGTLENYYLLATMETNAEKLEYIVSSPAVVGSRYFLLINNIPALILVGLSFISCNIYLKIASVI